MNAQSNCCAKALSHAIGLVNAHTPILARYWWLVGRPYIRGPLKQFKCEWYTVVFELPAIKPKRKTSIAWDLGEASDLFIDKSFRGPFDVVLFSNILHDWPYAANLKLLKVAFKCRRITSGIGTGWVCRSLWYQLGGWLWFCDCNKAGRKWDVSSFRLQIKFYISTYICCCSFESKAWPKNSLIASRSFQRRPIECNTRIYTASINTTITHTRSMLASTFNCN